MVWQEKMDFGDCFFDDDRHMLADEQSHFGFGKVQTYIQLGGNIYLFI